MRSHTWTSEGRDEEQMRPVWTLFEEMVVNGLNGSAGKAGRFEKFGDG